MNYAGMLVNFLDIPDPEKVHNNMTLALMHNHQRTYVKVNHSIDSVEIPLQRITEVINCNILSVTQVHACLYSHVKKYILRHPIQNIWAFGLQL